MKTPFKFLEPNRFVDKELELVLVGKHPRNPTKDWLPFYQFDMRLTAGQERIGKLNLRVGVEDSIFYIGHIGYSVEEKFRGNRYAARAIKLILPFARKNGIDPVWITVNPDNIASIKTCEIAGGELIETVDLPPDNEMYNRGNRQMCRFRF